MRQGDQNLSVGARGHVAGSLLRLSPSMGRWARRTFGMVATRWLAVGFLQFAPMAAHAANGRNGGRLYHEHCASCHGPAGRGDGPDGAIFASPPRDLREGFLQRYKTDDLVRRVRDGLPLELAIDLPAMRARAAEVEELFAYLHQLPRIVWRTVERGQQTYADRCAVCHGYYGRPGAPLPAGTRPPRDLSDPAFQRSINDEELSDLVRHGRKGMPALTPRVSVEDGRALAAFVRLLSPGFELYARYCSSCHGDDGRGANDLAEAIWRPTVVFDAAYFARRDPEKLRASIWHMVAEEKPTMPHYRTIIGEADARAIIEYLKRAQ